MRSLSKAIKILIMLGFVVFSVAACAGAGTPLGAVSKVQRLQNAG